MVREPLSRLFSHYVWKDLGRLKTGGYLPPPDTGPLCARLHKRSVVREDGRRMSLSPFAQYVRDVARKLHHAPDSDARRSAARTPGSPVASS